MNAPIHEPEYWLNLLRKKSAKVADWHIRQPLPGEAAHRLLTYPEDNSAKELLILLASDPKWEIRRAVARSMTNLPEPIFGTLVRLLSNDENDFVTDALKRAIQHREPKPARPRRSVHRELQQQLKEIEDVFGSAASRIASQFADRYGNEVLRTVAHDIKTILTPIKMSLFDITQKKGIGKDIRAIVARMENEINNLEALTIAINAFARPLELEMTVENLSALIGEAVETAVSQLRGQGKNPDPVQVSVQPTPPIRARISRPHILMALTNVIQNAVEAHAGRTGFRPGKVTITLGGTENTVRIVIADTGSGLSRTDLSKLKEYVPGHSSKSTGTGYGLPTAKRYIEAHRGTLWLDSEEGRGTTVTIHLPLNLGEN